MNRTILCCWLAGFSGACARTDPGSVCQPFFTALDSVPHAALSMRTGVFISTWDGARYDGCEVEFETSDGLRAGVPVPDFEAARDSEMHRRGWRASQGIRADGAGSGTFGIEKETELCVIRWSQPAYLFEEGEIVQSEMFSMTVQCREP